MKPHRSRLFIVGFLAPALILYAVFVLIPAFNAFRYSFNRWDGLTEPHWVGLKNFGAIFKSGDVFLSALTHNAYLMVVPGSITLCLALFFAYTLHRGLAGGRIFRIAFFFPNVISSVAISLLWVLIYSPTAAGLLNGVLGAAWGPHGRFEHHLPHALGTWLGQSTLPIPFTQSSRLLVALPPIIVWSSTGFFMVLFLAAMENIPETFYEAAKLDGASNTRMFFSVTLPLMWDVLTTGVVFIVIGSLKMFDMIWVMENGRPSKDTHTIATLMYSKVFEQYDIGYGTAIAVFLFVLILLATRITFRLMRRERLEY